MFKESELKNPSSCLNLAKPGEMLFVLRARDPAAPATIRFWVNERIESGKNKHDDPKMIEALQAAEMMEAQRPDLRK